MLPTFGIPKKYIFMKEILLKEFALLANIPSRSISTYLTRGKIVASKIEGTGKTRKVYFDIDQVDNSAFLLARKEHQQQSATDASSEPENELSIQELNKRIKLADLRLKAQKEYMQDIEIQRISGKLLRTDLVNRLTSEVILRYKSTFLQQADQLIRDLCNENGISNIQMTASLSKLTDIANNSSKRANQETKYVIEQIIESEEN
jgi:hypothetical protein